jgi:hypothetical protein
MAGGIAIGECALLGGNEDERKGGGCEHCAHS